MDGYLENPFGQNYSTGGGASGGGFFGGADGSQDGGGRPHSDAPFTFDNAELSQVTLVAWIQNMTNQFVRVLGEIKSFNNKRSVTAASIARLEDDNEYLFHQLDVIYTHLQLTKGAKQTKHTGPEASAYDDAGTGAVDVSSTDLSHLAPLQRKIYQAIAAEAPDWPEGVDVQQIMQRCKATDPAQVQDAIDELANDGYIYQASDETHYLTTAG
ncbi:Rfa2p [Malassezia vespertilionis]|uniref:Rfa2p n=1 Tax=Malassezia vespertilionis TaxID=2020962 RepID=A0A2N1JE85_9BASI|nr:Rfa2p [Malassezia vespertilionis]